MRSNALCLFAGILLPFAAECQAANIWQIGKFDESPVEFAQSALESVNFEVGKSEARRDWPARQQTGHSYRIGFSLNSVQGSYTLKIATLIDQPRVPALRVDVNGHAGVFFLHPKLSYSRSDFSYAFDPHESQSTVDIEIPAPFLKQGANTITVACVDEPPTPSGEKEIGGISYDALSLEQNVAKKSAAALRPAIDIQPTVFYKQSAAGL